VAHPVRSFFSASLPRIRLGTFSTVSLVIFNPVAYDLAVNA
jgi:hypothetical protein